MKRVINTISIILLTICLLINPLMVFTYAEETDPSFVTEGTYQFTSNENYNKQLTDTFIFREDCFMKSSFDDCFHLDLLSSQVAIASASWYGENEDKYEVDPSRNAYNLINMLEAMGFEDVSTNEYYTLEKLEDSAGVAVGHRTIKAFGKEYTLLAIMPRSAGYKQEWVGNFTVNEGDIHDGFKQGRDEILRYVKKYINEHNISGNLKVWTAGHSRGSALANMIGGFFAGGGIEYFDGVVSITPEDVYSYAYATPRTIKPGADKNIVLSVQGPRGAGYEKDTQTPGYTYTKGGTIDPKSDEYKGVYNFINYYDLITLLPPPQWGFTVYGSEEGMDHDGYVTETEMLVELEKLSQFAYDKYLDSGDPDSFAWKTFDVATLSMVDAPGPHSANDMGAFERERIVGLIYNAQTNADYHNDGYEETLKALAGIYGMMLVYFDEIPLDDIGSMIKPLLLSYLSYAVERLMAEGRASTESEAMSVALKDLIAYVTGKPFEPRIVEDGVVTLFTFLNDNNEQPVFDTIVDALGNLEVSGQKASDLLKMLYWGYVPGFGPEDDPSTLDFKYVLQTVIKACVEGVDPAASNYETAVSDVEKGLYKDTAQYARSTVAFVIGFAYSDLLRAMGGLKFEADFDEFVDELKKMLLTVKDDSGTVIIEYGDIPEGADEQLKELLTSRFADLIADTETRYTTDFHHDVERHFDSILNHIRPLRRLLLYMLFYQEGEQYNTKTSLENAVTFFSNVGIIPLAHYNELYIAWMRAVETKGHEECDHYIKHVEGKENTCTEDGELEHWTYHNDDTDRYFDDKYLTNEYQESDLILPKKGHDWDVWVVVKEPTEKETGLKVRTCKNDRSHKEEEVIPKVENRHYINTAGNHNVWVKGSNVTSNFTFKNTKDDTITYPNFLGIKVDGRDVSKSNYTYEEGSVIIKLKPSYLETLSIGKHTLTAMFDRGNDVTVEFTIVGNYVAVPNTGDNFHIHLYISLFSVSAIVFLIGVLCLKKYKYN